MNLPRRRFLHLAAGATALPAVSRIARAQAYPTRPITMVVPFPAGGSTDAIARIITERMRVSLGQPILVENVVGAGGSIGVGRAFSAAPDGYTLSIGDWTSHVGAPAIYPIRYDVLRDFEPVARIATNPLVIISKKSLPAQDFKELIAWLQANPDRASQGTSGAGSVMHVAGLSLQKQTGTRYQFVPYRGAAPAIQDLLAEQIDLLIPQAADALPAVRTGMVKAYAVTAMTRLITAPDIPTIDEAGLPGFHVSAWHGLWVRRGTPKANIDKLNAAVVGALADPLVRSRLIELGQEIPPRDQQTSEAIAVFHKAEIEKWWPIIKASGIKPE
jgi:tripartite-type tricarboxylate transporter receptor subunit TctC